MNTVRTMYLYPGGSVSGPANVTFTWITSAQTFGIHCLSNDPLVCAYRVVTANDQINPDETLIASAEGPHGVLCHLVRF